MDARFDAIVLAGGRGDRMSGQAKPQLPVGDATMLERVLSAADSAGTRIVVGPRQPVPPGVQLVGEEPPGSGPVAGLAAGLGRSSAALVVVLAADLPFLTSAAIDALVAELDGDADADGALCVDETGRGQYLLGAWRVEAIRRVLAGLAPLPGRAMRELLPSMRVRRVALPIPADAPAPWTDIDTPDDLRQARGQVRPTR